MFPVAFLRWTAVLAFSVMVVANGCQRDIEDAASPLLGIPGAHPADNGTFWASLNHSEKSAAIRTLVLGFSEGYGEGRFNEYRWVAQYFGEAKVDKIDKRVWTPRFSKTLRTYEADFDDFYSKNPNLKDMSMTSLLVCFADIPPKGCSDVHPKSTAGK